MRRLRTRDGRADGVGARLRTERALAAVDLRPRGLPPAAILLVRSLRARVGDAPAALADLLRTAARPAREPVPAGADAVVFANRAELLACLAADWCAGVASGRWWWSIVVRDDPRGPAGAWEETPEAVPAAFSLLVTHGRAVEFASRIEGERAEHLAQAVARAHGVAMPASEHVMVPGRIATRAGPPAPAPVAPARGADAPVQPRDPALEATAPGLSPPQRALLRLALTLQRAPAQLRAPIPLSAADAPAAASPGRTPRAPESPLRPPRAFAPPEPPAAGPAPPRPPAEPPARPALPASVDSSQAPAPPAAPEASSAGTTPAAAPASVKASRAGAGAQASVTSTQATDAAPGEAAAPPAATPARAAPPAGDDSSRARGPTPPAEHVGALPQEARERTEASPPPRAPDAAVTDEPAVPAAAAPPHAAPLPWRSQVETGLGGLLFLVGLAQRLGLYADFTEPTAPGIALDPWRFVALAGARLVDVEAHADDGLWALLDELARDDDRTLPPDELDRHVTAVRTWIETRVDLPLRTVLERPAVVYADDTRVDAVFSLAAHPIEIRIAGLDIDPGWIPAAGRALHFHFE